MSIPWTEITDPVKRQLVRELRRNRRAMLGRRAGKGIVGYAGTENVRPIRFRGKDHSARPLTSTKRLRLPGSGGKSQKARAAG